MPLLTFEGAPPSYSLAPGELHLWAIRLDAPVADANLSEAERERAARFRDPVHARRYVAAHDAMRRVLSRYVGVEPSALAFTTEGDEGKPSLLDIEAPAFNLTHTDDRALLAVFGGERVGVDLERVRELSDFPALALQYFTADERAAVAGDDRATRFFTVWTRKEAALKATGHGLTVDLRTIEVGAMPDERTVRFGQHTLNVTSFSTADGHIGALAVGPAGKIAALGTFDAGRVR
jgi:4'-phosphopantetheinyl transferase